MKTKEPHFLVGISVAILILIGAGCSQVPVKRVVASKVEIPAVGSAIFPVGVGAWHSYKVESVDSEGTIVVTHRGNKLSLLGTTKSQKVTLKRDEYLAEVEQFQLSDGRLVTKESTFEISNGFADKPYLQKGKPIHIFENGDIEINTYIPCDCPVGWLGKLAGSDKWAAYHEAKVFKIDGNSESTSQCERAKLLD